LPCPRARLHHCRVVGAVHLQHCVTERPPRGWAITAGSHPRPLLHSPPSSPGWAAAVGTGAIVVGAATALPWTPSGLGREGHTEASGSSCSRALTPMTRPLASFSSPSARTWFKAVAPCCTAVKTIPERGAEEVGVGTRTKTEQGGIWAGREAKICATHGGVRTPYLINYALLKQNMMVF
jgi:hypothetical protein